MTQHPVDSPSPYDAAMQDLAFETCGRSWRLRRADMEALWESMTEAAPQERGGWEEDERLPYWAELWPSSLALAAWLADNQPGIAGKVCLDIGCGLGFTALVGQWLGGRVIGMDYEAEALRYARINAELNAVSGVAWTVMDWRKPALRPGSIDRAWAGDIVYERRFAAPVAAFLADVLAPDGMAWIAEPGRVVFRSLLDELPGHGLAFARARFAPTWPLTPQKVPAPITIWEIRRI